MPPAQWLLRWQHRRLPNPVDEVMLSHFALGGWAQSHVNHRQDASHQNGSYTLTLNSTGLHQRQRCVLHFRLTRFIAGAAPGTPSSSQAVNSHISRIIDHRKSTHACTLIFPLPQAFPTNYNINISLSNPCIIAFIPTMNDSPVLCNFMSLCSSGFTDGLNSSKPP